MNISKLIFSASLLLVLTACKPTDDHIRNIVEQTLDENPKLVVDAFKKYQMQQEEEAAQSQSKAISEKSEQLKNDGYSVVFGNPEGDVTVIAFKDYRCGYCKRSWGPLMKLIADDKDVRLVIKEMPILGPHSMRASRFGLASKEQGKYPEYYTALIKHRGPWDTETLKKIATNIGLDAEKLSEDAKTEKVQGWITQTLELSSMLGISGTPAFVIGDTLYPGAVSLSEMQKAVAATRKAQ
ncbi:MAG: DsbA family protein [Pseudomonadota bacterium]